jgi:hypothetical protein
MDIGFGKESEDFFTFLFLIMGVAFFVSAFYTIAHHLAFFRLHPIFLIYTKIPLRILDNTTADIAINSS